MRQMHKLTPDHLNPQGSVKMRVCLATQVLSSTVAEYARAPRDAGAAGLGALIRVVATGKCKKGQAD